MSPLIFGFACFEVLSTHALRVVTSFGALGPARARSPSQIAFLLPAGLQFLLILSLPLPPLGPERLVGEEGSGTFVIASAQTPAGLGGQGAVCRLWSQAA